MYELFELNKLFSVASLEGGPDVKIVLSAYVESTDFSVLALACSNGYLLFRYLSTKNKKPVMRQLHWFCNPSKNIRALTFDAAGNSLLVVSADATLYILPVLPHLKMGITPLCCLSSDDVTEIKLSGQRASLTCVRWWQTLQGHQIAIIGSELGEISFINLLSKKEVGGTYVSAGITDLDILNDESHDTTYLLITGNNRQQWRLLLEEKKTEFYWPANAEIEVIPCNGSDIASSDEKTREQRHYRLSKFESGTFLTPQSGGGRNLVSAYNSSSSLLQVLEGDLDQMHLFSYKLTPNCENIILSDKLIFLTQNYQSSSEKEATVLRILSRKFAEVTSENVKKKENQDAEIQTFVLDNRIIAMYKQHSNSNSIHRTPCSKVLASDTSKLQSSDKHVKQKTDKESDYCTSLSGICVDPCTSKETEKEVINIQSNIVAKEDLHGCLIIQKDSVWQCHLRISPAELFLSYTAAPSDLPQAERLGVMLGLDIHRLYEIAAEEQLSSGHFAQAVHLYQLSKCPQLKRIAHFMSYGYLSELIAYIQVLFSTKSVEIAPEDKCHFANIALHCFVQQVLEKVQERSAITLAFKKFLRDNAYYDEEVAARLLAEQGLYDLLHYFAEVRAQHGLIVHTLLSTDGIRESLDCTSYEALINAGFENILCRLDDEDYMRCMTSFQLLQFLAGNPKLLSFHLQHLITLLPKMNIGLLSRVASLYDPSREMAKLALRNIAALKHSNRYWSISSLNSMGNDILDAIHNEDESTNEEDVIKFFIFVLLMLAHKRNQRKFNMDLLPDEVPTFWKSKTFQKSTQVVRENEILSEHLACGLAHAAFIRDGIVYTWGKTGNGRLGNGQTTSDYQVPGKVEFLLRLQVRASSVSCGALHTLVLTDCGVFAWGSSQYGQLGVEEIQRATHPIIIESLIHETIITVKCGQYHSLALTEDGRVYSWGWGVHGQLGHGNPENLNVPKVIQRLKDKPIASVDAGQCHSVLLSKCGEIYTFGCGMFGQLGTGSISKSSVPRLVTLPEPMKLIASGFFHVVVVSESNKIYIWGSNPQALRLQAQNSRRARQQSSSHSLDASFASSSSKVMSPRSSTAYSCLQQTHLVPNLIDCSSISVPVVKVSCGSHHSAVLTLDGEVYCWGRNTEGQVGNGTRREQKVLCSVLHLNDRKLMDVACGADFTITIDCSGRLWGWGQNDGGQVGKKPAPEASSRVPSNSSSGRVITIRTNRRMITITQPCRQSILRPVEITIPNEETSLQELDSGSFDNEYSIPRLLYHRPPSCRDIQVPNLFDLDDPPYGPYALHTILKVFHHCYDSAAILNHCLSFSDFQAAAKVCTLELLYAQAVEYQLRALTMDHSLHREFLSTVLEVINFYARLMDSENMDANLRFVENVLKFWIKNNLQVEPLELFFQSHLDIFSYPLSFILFSNGLSKDMEPNVFQKFFDLISTTFCLSITASVIKQMQNSRHHSELMEQVIGITETSALFKQIHATDTLTAWDDSILPGRLWQELLHNMQKEVISHSTIHLTGGDVDILAKSLASEKLCSQAGIPSSEKEKEKGLCGGDIIVFTCGHHYTMHTFQTSVLPGFWDLMQKLPYPLPQTTKLLQSTYQLKGLTPAACPRCVLTDIKS